MEKTYLDVLNLVKERKPELVFFDIGKVLNDVNFSKQGELAAQYFNIEHQTYKKFIKTHFDALIMGTLSSIEFNKLFRETFGVEEDLTSFREKTYVETVTRNHELFDQLDDIKELTRVSIISNIFPESVEVLRKQQFFDIFETPVLSCEINMKKPHHNIYEYALQQFPEIDPSNILFIDDRLENIDAAVIAGMQAELYTKYRGSRHYLNV